MKMGKKVTVALVGVIGMYVAYVFATQRKLEVGGGIFGDAVSYHAIYECFNGNENSYSPVKDGVTYEALAKTVDPFNQRIGVPFVASLLKIDKFIDFTIVNCTCFFIGLALLLYKWIRKKNNNVNTALIFGLTLLVSPQIPFRFILFDPMIVEGALFLFICMVVFWYKNPQLILILTLLFLPFKEATVPVGILYFTAWILCSLLAAGKLISMDKVKKCLPYAAAVGIIFATYVFYRFLLTRYLNVTFHLSGLVVFESIKNNILDYTFYLKVIACSFVAFLGYWIFLIKKAIINKNDIHTYIHTYINQSLLQHSLQYSSSQGRISQGSSALSYCRLSWILSSI